MKKFLIFALLIFCFPFTVKAQFSSGSTGADGALDLSTMSCGSCEVQLPESGILNYTTVIVPAGKELRFRRNTRNTPVIMLAQGNVTISGAVILDALGSTPGPGGFYGGQIYLSGFGPGGGTASNVHGRWVGPLSLVPIVGGSGGAGGQPGGTLASGGGGGGAIVIASSTSITVTGHLIAQGQGNNGFNLGFGSGGAIRLVANNLTVSGGFDACVRFIPSSSNCGVVRLEATSLTFTGSSSPPATLSTINPNIVSSAQPQLTIQSVGGYQVPSYAGSRFDTIDLLLPNQIPDPVNVVVQANNIPVGSEVTVGFVSGSTSGTSTSCNLSGTLANSQCTATISNLNRTGVTYLLATTTFTPPSFAMKFNPKGKNQVAKIRLESVLGAKPKYVFLRKDGSVIDTANLSPQFLQHLGM